jgi:hypothetical protein
VLVYVRIGKVIRPVSYLVASTSSTLTNGVMPEHHVAFIARYKRPYHWMQSVNNAVHIEIKWSNSGKSDSRIRSGLIFALSFRDPSVKPSDNVVVKKEKQ